MNVNYRAAGIHAMKMKDLAGLGENSAHILSDATFHTINSNRSVLATEKWKGVCVCPQLLRVFTSSLHESFHKGKTILNFNFASPLPFHISHHKIG